MAVFPASFFPPRHNTCPTSNSPESSMLRKFVTRTLLSFICILPFVRCAEKERPTAPNHTVGKVFIVSCLGRNQKPEENQFLPLGLRAFGFTVRGDWLIRP